jgi:hypothetical protein
LALALPGIGNVPNHESSRNVLSTSGYMVHSCICVVPINDDLVGDDLGEDVKIDHWSSGQGEDQ